MGTSFCQALQIFHSHRDEDGHKGIGTVTIEAETFLFDGRQCDFARFFVFFGQRPTA